MSDKSLSRARRRLAATLPTWAAVAASLALGACGNTLERLRNVGAEPKLSEITNPTQDPNYRPVSLPMPKADTEYRAANSLWRAGSRAFLSLIHI